MVKVYYDKDCNPDLLTGKKIAIIGYGSQGHAHALNLRDSGYDVIIGLYEGSKSWSVAEEAGFTVMTTGEAVAAADVIMFVVNDEKQADIYKKDIEPNLSEGKALGFAHGFNIHFGFITPPENVDIFMVAPKGPGHAVRSLYVAGKGVPSLISVYQDYSGHCKDLSLAYACGIGAARAGVIETTFKEETETDLFGEQCVLCGGVVDLMRTGFEVLVEAGYQPEMAYFETMHEMKMIVDLMNKGGIAMMNYSISDTAEYGQYVSGPRVIDAHVKENMKTVLSEIQDGTFARNWILENQAGRPFFTAARRKTREHQCEQVGNMLRTQMLWVGDQDPDTACV